MIKMSEIGLFHKNKPSVYDSKEGLVKPRVGYTNPQHIKVGQRAAVFVPEHPNHMLEHYIPEDCFVSTSTVIKYDNETGEFETQNTIYYLIHKWDKDLRNSRNQREGYLAFKAEGCHYRTRNKNYSLKNAKKGGFQWLW